MAETGKAAEMKYKIPEIVKFRFRPNSLDVNGDEVILMGVIDGISYEEKAYDIQLADNDRKIYGRVHVPEKEIMKRLNLRLFELCRIRYCFKSILNLNL